MRTLLSSPEKIEMAIKLMCSSDAWDGMLARMGSQLTHYKDKELNSTLTTTSRFLRFLDTIAVSESTKTSSFDPADLRKGKMTVYMILPPETHAYPITLASDVDRFPSSGSGKGRTSVMSNVTFVLDEAASLGHMGRAGRRVG